MGTFFSTEFGEEIWKKKYAGTYTYPGSYYWNMAKTVSLEDAELTSKFYEMLVEGRFSPGGRILAWAGRRDASLSLMNCTTHQVESDSLEAITATVHSIMKASSHGQGIGIDISKLRPKGAVVNNAAKTSTGAISFMEMFNSVGATIGQEGRRAAVLYSMHISHPDVYRPGAKDVECPRCHGKGCMKCRGQGSLPYDFLHVKSIPGKVESANISVMISDEFMHAVRAKAMWKMHFDGKSGGESFHVETEVPAEELFNELARMAWSAAEPGVLFEDNIHRMSNSDRFGKAWEIVGTNACSEMPLDHNGVCNLGSLILDKYIENPFTDQAWFNFPKFVDDIWGGVEFLDNILTIELDEERSVSPRQEDSVYMLRRVGLGVMGLADALTMMGLPYSTSNPQTVALVTSIFETLRNNAYLCSTRLAQEKGPAGVWEDLEDEKKRRLVIAGGFYGTLPGNIKEEIFRYGLRNVTLLSIAPTGSISNLLGVSSGIEPLFALEYLRRVQMSGEDVFVTVAHPLVQASRDAGRPDSIWDTAYSVSPEDHVCMQALIQQFVDSSIAKTTNLPKDASIQDVANIYMLAWELGLKGITVYRDGSRETQVLYQTEGTSDTCPHCGTPLVKQDGCEKCPSCDYGKCG